MAAHSKKWKRKRWCVTLHQMGKYLPWKYHMERKIENWSSHFFTFISSPSKNVSNPRGCHSCNLVATPWLVIAFIFGYSHYHVSRAVMLQKCILCGDFINRNTNVTIIFSKKIIIGSNLNLILKFFFFTIQIIVCRLRFIVKLL